METNTWPQLAEGLYGFLTGREATLEYTVDKMEIWVPRDTTRDAPQARWQVNVTVGGARSHLLARGNLVELDLEQPRRFVSAAGFGGWRALRLLALQLDRLGLTVRIQSRGAALITLGRQARAGMVGRLLGAPHLEISGRLSLWRLLR